MKEIKAKDLVLDENYSLLYSGYFREVKYIGKLYGKRIPGIFRYIFRGLEKNDRILYEYDKDE